MHTPPRRVTAVVTLAAAALGLALGLSGCASRTGRLDVQPATPSPSCRVHQTKEPGGQYTAGPGADTGAVLEMMRYYAANAAKPFCDGAPATDADRRWTELYAELGGRRV
ncbi:hypothetical protein [Streptomyces hypolithicus]